MQPITQEILTAIKKFLSVHGGGARRIAELAGVSPASSSCWINGSAKSIRDENWEKLEPHLRPYLRGTPHMPPATESNAEFLTSPLPTYPVITLAAAAECNTSIMPMVDYADANSEDRVPFPNGRIGDVAIRVVGDSMEPWYPSGTIVLVRPNASLRSGDGVIAILADGSVVFKTYVERKNSFLLLSINEESGSKFEFKKTDYFAVRGLYLVIGSLRDEIKLRETMHANGKHHFWEKYLDEHTGSEGK